MKEKARSITEYVENWRKMRNEKSCSGHDNNEGDG